MKTIRFIKPYNLGVLNVLEGTVIRTTDDVIPILAAGAAVADAPEPAPPPTPPSLTPPETIETRDPQPEAQRRPGRQRRTNLVTPPEPWPRL